MDTSRRAVESYWRSRMIDAATSDEDKVTPVYKLEEICELLRSSHASIVKEISEFLFKRLEHKSPIVKQKALRLIKYSAGKSGTEFRREVQRNSAAVRQLFHYKGQPDPLKGDALNKAVRDTAHEALSAMFAADDNKSQPAEDLNRRIQGFGNTNFEPSDDKKSFLSEVVGIGSATIKQGFNNFTQAQSSRKNESGSYKSPTLRRSLTTEIDYPDRYDRVLHQNENQATSQLSKNATAGPWGQDLKVQHVETTNGDSASSHSGSKSREEKLVETIATSGGVRLQPTRDAIQVFLVEASKLDALAVSHAIESKLHSPSWQVRMKAVCLLEAILRKKEEEYFSIIASYFYDNIDILVTCSESPQASLREKSNKVLNLLDWDQTNSSLGHQEKPLNAETIVQMPDLIDTGDPVDDILGMEDTVKAPTGNPITPTNNLMDDLLGDNLDPGMSSTSEQKNDDDDPFADVSFHTNNDKERVADLFSGMNIDKPGASKNTPEQFDIFGYNPVLTVEQENPRKDVNDIMAGLSINENASSSPMNPSNQVPKDVLNGVFGSHVAGMNTNTVLPLGSMPYNLSSVPMFNPGAFPPQPINYGPMGSLFAQQQFLATMSNFQQLGTLHTQNGGAGLSAGINTEGYSSPIPDIFNPSIPTQTPSSMINSSKKEDTKAFDFISDHLAAARDPKKVI